jgi:hypothetical protein
MVHKSLFTKGKVGSADTCGGKFTLMLMGGQAEGLGCANPGARIPIGVSNFLSPNLTITKTKTSGNNITTFTKLSCHTFRTFQVTAASAQV